MKKLIITIDEDNQLCLDTEGKFKYHEILGALRESTLVVEMDYAEALKKIRQKKAKSTPLEER